MELKRITDLLSDGKRIFDLDLRVAYYARVSTDKEEQLNSLENQVQFFDEYINKNTNWTFIDGYVDEGLPGSSVEKRHSFLRMIEDGRCNKFDLIITKEVARFARNTLDSIQYTRELLRHGVGVFFLTDNINTLEPDSELRLTIMSSLAQEEVRKLSDRLKFGFKRSIEKGVVLGQNNMIGYNKEDGVLTVVEEEAKFVRKVFNMYIEGKLGLRAIARELEKEGYMDSKGNMYGFATLRNIISNPKYKGFYCGKKTYSPNYREQKKVRIPQDEWVVYKDDRIPAIVSEEMWDQANILLKQRGARFKEHKEAYQNRYPYSGKLICAEHGTTFHRHIYKSKRRGEQEVWNCKLYRLKGKVEGCDSPTIYSAELDEIMTEVYNRLYKNRDAIIDEMVEVYREMINDKDTDKEIARITSAIEKINKKKEKLLELHIESIIDKFEFGERNNALNAELQNLQMQVDELKKQKINAKSNDLYLQQVKGLLEQEWSGVYDSSITSVILDSIIVHKTSDKNLVKLEIILKFGDKLAATMDKISHCITLDEIGISQAQVSRLEKTALNNIKKHF